MSQYGPYGTGWRYLENVGASPFWIENDYDDSGWPVGQGGFGPLGPNPSAFGRVVHTNWPTFNGSYIRNRLTIGPRWSGAQVFLNCDDDCAIWVDGQPFYSRPVWTGASYVFIGYLPDITEDVALAAYTHDLGLGFSYFDMYFVFPSGGATVG